MKTDVTGTHIIGAATPAIQPSKSQGNSLAFLDADNHWIHLDKETIVKLYNVASNTANEFHV